MKLPRRSGRALEYFLTAVSLFIPAYFFYLSNRAYFALHRMENDEGFFVWGGWSILHGLTPYRDFIEFKPPMVFITHAVAQALFGLEGRGFRKFFLLLPLAGLVTFQLSLISQRVNRILAATLACGVTYLLVNKTFHDSSLGDSESIGLGYFLLGFGLLLLDTRFRRTADSIAGFLFCCSVFSKEPYAPEIALAWLGVFLFRRGARRWRQEGWPMLRASLVGIAVFVVALSLYLVPTGGMSAYLEMAARYTRLYQDPMQGYCVVLGRVHPSTPLHDLHRQWDQARREFFNFDLLGFLVPLGLLTVVFVARRSAALFLVMIATAGAAFWSVRASNCQWMHYYILSQAGLATLLAFGCLCSREALALAPRAVRIWAIGAIVAVAGTAIVPRYDEVSAAKPVYEADTEPLPGLVKLITGSSSPDDRIWTTGNPYLYVQTGRAAATRYSTFDDEIMAYYPGATDEEKLRPIYDELVRARPALVFVDPDRPQRRIRNMKSLIMPFLTDNHYVRINEHVYRRP